MSIAGHMGNFGYSDFGLRVTTDGDEPSHLVKVRYPYDHFPLVEVHRQVASLCAWLVALDQDTVLDVQVPEPDDDGQMCQLIDHRPDGPAAVCTVQRWLPGTDLVGTDEGVDELPRETFVVLGELLRRVHDHGRRWQRPRGFNRMRTDWLADVAEVEQDYWNSRGDEGLSADEHLLLKHATELLVRHREASHEPWGLTHGDFHAGNCIVHQGRTSPIDFDHCALSYQFDDAGWFLATVENPDMRRAFLEGYTAAKREQKDFIRLMEGALIAGRTRRCAWGGPVPGELIKDCEDYLSGRSFIF
jgi:Ser/Thr protein kinase RdoA (MazF antagonist)